MQAIGTMDLGPIARRVVGRNIARGKKLADEIDQARIQAVRALTPVGARDLVEVSHDPDLNERIKVANAEFQGRMTDLLNEESGVEYSAIPVSDLNLEQNKGITANHLGVLDPILVHD